MDSWASDGFYSHFPSYSQQPTRREALARARQLDYQTFLSRVSPGKSKTDGKAQKRHTTNDGQSKRQKIPTTNRTPNEKLPKLNANAVNENNIEGDMQSGGVNKDHYLDELEKMDLPDILNEETINERNLKLAEVIYFSYQSHFVTQNAFESVRNAFILCIFRTKDCGTLGISKS